MKLGERIGGAGAPKGERLTAARLSEILLSAPRGQKTFEIDSKGEVKVKTERISSSQSNG